MWNSSLKSLRGPVAPAHMQPAPRVDRWERSTAKSVWGSKTSKLPVGTATLLSVYYLFFLK